ncbi:hypothetical protein LguiB_005167 [Lonicera macranthoides]
MAFFCTFLGCFPDYSRVASQIDDVIISIDKNTRMKLESSRDGAKSKKRKFDNTNTPIPVSYFPTGPKFSQL